MSSSVVCNSDGTITMPQAYFEKLIDITAQKAAKKAGEHTYAKIIESKTVVDQFDKRLYNVRLLFENYLMLKEHVKNAVFEIEWMEEETAIEIIDSMWQSAGTGKGELAIESIKKSTIRTDTILKHVESMMRVYEVMASNCAVDIERRRYETIRRLYMIPLPQGQTRTDVKRTLSKEFCIDERQVRRDIKDAFERITAMIFGIDGITTLNKRKNSKTKPIDKT